MPKIKTKHTPPLTTSACNTSADQMETVLETTENAIEEDCADDDYTNAEKLEMLTSSLISTVGVRSCVRFYCVAEEVGAASLLEYCSGLISTHWDDLTPQDFELMCGPLLFKMLKSKTKYPLFLFEKLRRCQDKPGLELAN
uniref:Uncharacterized protein n=1 Tax=Glossina palpalis gambiensis TaxID=67801 RepID=A0A1B0BH76_9MUSC